MVMISAFSRSDLAFRPQYLQEKWSRSKILKASALLTGMSILDCVSMWKGILHLLSPESHIARRTKHFCAGQHIWIMRRITAAHPASSTRLVRSPGKEQAVATLGFSQSAQNGHRAFERLQEADHLIGSKRE